MYPAYLIRAGIDWVRHSDEFKNSNPYSRCESTIKTCQRLWKEQIGKPRMELLEPTSVAAYWSEFFHAEDPLPDEKQWRDGLVKLSGSYDSFPDWQASFKKTYAQVYKEDNIWFGLLMISWAHTHQYEVVFVDDAWEFRPAVSYLPTSEMWRLEPHMQTVSELILESWQDEKDSYQELGFKLQEQDIPYMGKAECLGFDTKKQLLIYPPQVALDAEALELGEMVADVVTPAGLDWYRHLDNIIFANDSIDVTALTSRVKYFLGSKRRLMELTVQTGQEKAKDQATAEGWLVQRTEAASL